MLSEIIKNCPLFAKNECPHQNIVEKLYLTPQYATPEDIEKIRSSECCAKNVFCSDNAEKILASLQQS